MHRNASNELAFCKTAIVRDHYNICHSSSSMDAFGLCPGHDKEFGRGNRSPLRFNLLMTEARSGFLRKTEILLDYDIRFRASGNGRIEEYYYSLEFT